MKLYHQPRTRSARVLWMINELELPCEIEQVNVFVGEGRKPEYRKKHPHGFVPALEDDGLLLIESAAICMHLADTKGGGKLAPKVGTRERAKYYELMVYVPATADPCLEAIMFNTIFLPEDKRDAKLVERSKKKWAETIEPRYRDAIAASEAAGTKYILGESFSAADVIVGSSLAWAKMAGVLSNDAVVARYLERITARPAFIAAHS